MSIAEHHERCAHKFHQLSELLTAVSTTTTASVPAVKSDVDDERDRYILWAENVGAHQSGSNSTVSLDYRLREAPFYRDRVINLLAVLERYLDKGIDAQLDSSQENQGDTESESGSESQLFDTEYGDGEAAATSNNESSSWDISDTDSNLSLQRSRDQAPSAVDHEEKPESPQSIPLRGIRHTVDCFYQLPLRRPAPISRLREHSEHELCYYEHYDVLYVRDKFPNIDETIATRLGKLITRRRQLLAYRKGHQDKLQKTSMAAPIARAMTTKIVVAVQSAAKSVAEESASEPTIRAESQKTRITDLTKATTTADDDRVTDHVFTVPESRPATSVAASETTRKVRLHIPPRPLPKTRANELGISITQTERTKRAEFFKCNYCRLLPHITSDLAWRRHVLLDLQPYVCTFLECELSSHFFTDRDAWYAHEKQHHRLEFHCNTNTHPSFRDEGAFIKHMKLVHEMNIQLHNFNTMRKMFLRPVREMSGDCNLCGMHTGNMKLHVSRHLEQLALFAVPRVDYTGDDDQEEDGDSNAARRDLEGSRGEDEDSENEGSHEKLSLTDSSSSSSLSAEDVAEHTRIYKCFGCGEPFSTARERDIHYEGNHFFCPLPQCGLLFDSSQELKKHTSYVHVRIAWPYRQFVCEHCGETFQTIPLRDLHHEKIHFRCHDKGCTDAYPSQQRAASCNCQYCYRDFQTHHDLVVHQAEIHFLCPKEHCKMGSNSAQALAKHMRQLHRAENNFYGRYLCSTCPESFEDRFIRDVHVIEKHSPDPGQYYDPASGYYCCQFCFDLFEVASDRDAHEQTNHTPELRELPNPSNNTLKEFGRRCGVSASQGLFFCQWCTKIFHQREDRDKHERRNHIEYFRKVYRTVFDFTGHWEERVREERLRLRHQLGNLQGFYRCQYCRKGWLERYRRDQHEDRTHFPCPEIDCSFHTERSDDLVVHAWRDNHRQPEQIFARVKNEIKKVYDEDFEGIDGIAPKEKSWERKEEITEPGRVEEKDTEEEDQNQSLRAKPDHLSDTNSGFGLQDTTSAKEDLVYFDCPLLSCGMAFDTPDDLTEHLHDPNAHRGNALVTDTDESSLEKPGQTQVEKEGAEKDEIAKEKEHMHVWHEEGALKHDAKEETPLELIKLGQEALRLRHQPREEEFSMVAEQAFETPYQPSPENVQEAQEPTPSQPLSSTWDFATSKFRDAREAHSALPPVVPAESRASSPMSTLSAKDQELGVDLALFLIQNDRTKAEEILAEYFLDPDIRSSVEYSLFEREHPRNALESAEPYVSHDISHQGDAIALSKRLLSFHPFDAWQSLQDCLEDSETRVDTEAYLRRHPQLRSKWVEDPDIEYWVLLCPPGSPSDWKMATIIPYFSDPYGNPFKWRPRSLTKIHEELRQSYLPDVVQKIDELVASENEKLAAQQRHDERWKVAGIEPKTLNVSEGGERTACEGLIIVLKTFNTQLSQPLIYPSPAVAGSMTEEQRTQEALAVLEDLEERYNAPTSSSAAEFFAPPELRDSVSSDDKGKRRDEDGEWVGYSAMEGRNVLLYPRKRDGDGEGEGDGDIEGAEGVPAIVVTRMGPEGHD